MTTPILPRLFPTFVETEETDPHQVKGALDPVEAEFVSRAVEKRVREFTAGRVCARRALGRLGVEDFPLRVAEDRRPVWPDGFVGSITHTKGFCGVAVATRSQVASVGVDVEVVNSVKERVQEAILTGAEQEWVAAQDEPGRWATLMFSAKEAFYKCWYGVHERFLEFHDVELTVHPDPASNAGRFEATFLRDKGDRGEYPLTGRYRFHENWVCTGVVFKAGPA